MSQARILENLANAIASDKRMAFQLHLYDVDASRPGWADAAAKHALYTPSVHFYLRELIKKGVKPGHRGQDLFRVACFMDRTGVAARLLLKAGYRPDATMMSILVGTVRDGSLANAPQLVAALPKEDRKMAIAQLSAAAAMGSLRVEDIDRVDKMWKGRPDRVLITDLVLATTHAIKRPVGEAADILLNRDWVSAESLTQSGNPDEPLARVLVSRLQAEALAGAAASVSASPRKRRL